MEMRNKSLTLSNKLYSFVFKKIGLDRRNAQTLDTLNLVQSLYQVKKSVLVLFVAKLPFPVVTNVYPCKNDLLYSFFADLFCILQDIL